MTLPSSDQAFRPDPMICYDTAPMPIRILSQLLVSQIAAGEVIERPASVVKELIDNSLDAGATQVDITIEDGGRRLIRIADNGSGIAPDELPLAITAHATSKLQSAEQLSAITTLGFRGEALASIASVSRLRMTSRPTLDGQPADAGATVRVEGDQVTPAEPSACAPGTVIEVRDLFFSTPARRRFLRTAQTEYSRITDLVNRVAMVHPHVGFAVTHGPRRGIDLPAGQDRRGRCVSLIGKELDEVLLEFDTASQPDPSTGVGHGSVWGLAGTPAVRAGDQQVSIPLYKRPADPGSQCRPCREGSLPRSDPSRPAPSGRRLHRPGPCRSGCERAPDQGGGPFPASPTASTGLVLTAIRQRLLSADLTPSAALNAPPAAIHAAGQPSANFVPAAGSNQPGTGDGFVDYFRRQDPKQAGFDLQEVARQIGEAGNDPIGAASRPSRIPPAVQPACWCHRPGVS